MTNPLLGILTGISYLSGLDYFQGINQAVTKAIAVGKTMSPNPEIVMVSVDCDRYVHLLNSGSYAGVDEHLLGGVQKLVNAGCNLLAIASNTGHICVPAVRKAHPNLDIVHIADCSAAEMRRCGFSKVGLVGTKPTMEEDYLKAQLRLHNIDTVVPEDANVRDRMYEIICQELSFNNFRDESRDFFVNQIRNLSNDGAEAVLLGCTEIELLVKQDDIPDVRLLPSAQLHIAAIAEILLGRLSLDSLLPATQCD